MTGTAEGREFFGDVIYKYTRAQAIEEGVLEDVTEVAKEAGVKVPVALTKAVWEGCIVPDERSRLCGQSEAGRLWDVLSVFTCCARSAKPGTDTIFFTVRFIMKERQRRNVRFKAVLGGGDEGGPVITIMLPEED
ncbi:MAG: hypothetical protein KA801_02545 [Syntrophorhabdaceae bacterium]|nr:hypothetical protein [Syntrophorhabdaceae bacterium]